ncbi:hypothetical protein D3C86_1825800 [compost metagenome]
MHSSELEAALNFFMAHWQAAFVKHLSLLRFAISMGFDWTMRTDCFEISTTIQKLLFMEHTNLMR